MDQEQPAAICGRAVLENIVNNGKAHSDESSRQRAIALTMMWRGGGVVLRSPLLLGKF